VEELYSTAERGGHEKNEEEEQVLAGRRKGTRRRVIDTRTGRAHLLRCFTLRTPSDSYDRPSAQADSVMSACTVTGLDELITTQSAASAASEHRGAEEAALAPSGWCMV
jgi:hypothetical protein